MLINKFAYQPRFLCNADNGSGDAGTGGGGAPASVKTDTTPNPSAAATVSTTAGEAAKVSQGETSATASVPAGVGGADPNATPDWRSGWDDTLKNDPALKDVKDPAALAKMYLDTKKLVGQKLGIPGKDATPEAKAAFHEAMGVPKDAAGYEFKAPENLPEALKGAYDQAHADKWAARMRELGIPKEAANTLRNELFNEMTEELKGINAEAEKSDAKFAEMAKGIYGDDAKVTAALQNVRTMIEKHAPPALKDAAKNLPNSALLLAAAVIRGETLALTGEDKTIGKDDGSNSGGQTKEQLRAEARRLQALPEYSSPFTAKGKEEHQRVVKEVKSLYDRIGQMG